MQSSTSASALLVAALALGLGACRAGAQVEASPRIDTPAFRVAHDGLLNGPGGAPIASDPCPESPTASGDCAHLVSARRISWFGYLARWMRTFQAFDTKPQGNAPWADLPAEQFGFGVVHPDKLLVLEGSNGSFSQYVQLHDTMGEPLDDFGAETQTAVQFRTQHTAQVTAGTVKQACRISISLSGQIAARLSGGALATSAAALFDTLVTADKSNGAVTKIRAFKPAIGYLAYGRKLEASELAPLNALLGAGSAKSDGFKTFRTALTGLMCSTQALVE